MCVLLYDSEFVMLPHVYRRDNVKLLSFTNKVFIIICVEIQVSHISGKLMVLKASSGQASNGRLLVGFDRSWVVPGSDEN